MKEASAEGARKFKASTSDPAGYAGYENSSGFELISDYDKLANNF